MAGSLLKNSIHGGFGKGTSSTRAAESLKIDLRFIA
jgi:hypothetical protein